MPAKDSQLNLLLVDDEESGDAVFWKKVEEAVSNGGQIWIRSRLLSPFLDAMGDKIGDKPAFRVSRAPEQTTEKYQRLFDVLLSGFGLIALSPMLIAVSILVKLRSPGPVFYRTVVVGKGKVPFIWRKFRSLTVTPEAEDAAKRRKCFEAYVRGRNDSARGDAPGKVVEEQRITSVGRLLRKFSIDELPQLWNVLKGDMSLVGPRPCLPYEADFFSGWREIRFRVRPGLTGVWQVFGRGCSGFDSTAAMDVYYVFRRSVPFNLYLILKTIGVMLNTKGAQ